MIEQIDYKTLSVNGKIICFPARINEKIEFEKYNSIVLNIWPDENDIEYSNDYRKPPFINVHCYDMEGNLKWKYPRGITGMKKIDEDTVRLYDGSYANYVKVLTGETIRIDFVK